ncbi:7TMR-DISMED2 domain-containing protein [Pedobacter sp.]
MKRWLCCFLLITAQLIAKSDTVFVSSIGEQIKFSALKGVKVAQTPISEQPVLINDTSFKPFQPDYKTKSKQAYWLKITLTNNAPYNKTLYINSSMCDYAFLYQKVNNDLVQIAKAGRLVPHRDLAVKYSYLFLPLILKKSETNTYYIYVYNKHIDAPYLDFYLYDNKDLLFETYRDKFDESAITLYFLGAFTFLSLFILFMYYKSRHRIYLFYALYLIGAILYSLTRLSPISILGNWFANFPLWRISFNEPAQFICDRVVRHQKTRPVSCQNIEKLSLRLPHLRTVFLCIYQLLLRPKFTKYTF